MKDTKKKLTAVIICAVLSASLTACGHKETETGKAETGRTETDTIVQTEGIKIEQPQGTAAEQAKAAPKLIEDQTFQVTLNPLGEVTFSSYEPDTQRDPLGDAVFTLQKNGNVLCTLEGMYGDNSRPNEVFNRVEAVSFPDFDSDGNNDIVILCSYSPSSGPETGTGYSEARIYRGNAEGTFTLERELTDAANSAVAEKTVRSILGFIGAGKKAADTSDWRQAYLSYLDSNPQDQWAGYNLIYVNDDDIPELAQIGRDEAAGCQILTYSDGTVTETAMYRLNFTYIERGNLLCNSDGHMGRYYDLIYSITDGRMTQVAAGYYGDKGSRPELDDEGRPIFTYAFATAEKGVPLPDSLDQALAQGPVLTEEEYMEALNQVYDTSRETPGYQWEQWYSLEELKQRLY